MMPGPPNVVGIRGGAILRLTRHPTVFMTGEADYIRKRGAFEVHVLAARTRMGSPQAWRSTGKMVRLTLNLKHCALSRCSIMRRQLLALLALLTTAA